MMQVAAALTQRDGKILIARLPIGEAYGQTEKSEGSI